jgi:hypothetical protein
MKAAEDGRRCDVAHVLDGATDWSVFVERQMSPQLIDATRLRRRKAKIEIMAKRIATMVVTVRPAHQNLQPYQSCGRF